MKAYKFTMVPEQTNKVEQWAIVSDELAEKMEADNFDANEFFEELDDDRHPGYILAAWEEADLEEAKQCRPYEIY